ncbi:lysophospholipid acyltransferase family protein [Sphingomonas alba]|uniref:1-acyl-sn-glycerol-3-phosphate acyltransferase n=1 Tax=Sphingomonas alba TaxID=2908208 RepID=A0ABT0RP32_9SPHN|nr:lysophospholipid acyltransferase family protein [Sphingomonas alba]MCL6684391.1 1-acyl-sn-glycerol-3-phosphate acyltransferase [Sphingomonas alba]
MASLSIAAAELPSSRLRAYRRLAGLLLFFALCVPPHLVAKAFGRSRWPRRFLKLVAWGAGIDFRIDGPLASRGTLLLANHVSWLDIPILAAATGCAFVSKAEVQDHWFLKWIADQNETIYIDRSVLRSIHGQLDALSNGLKRPKPLALFPEGTVSDGGRLLPFKPSLLSAVAPPPEGVIIRPVAIDYGRIASIIGWGTGEPGLQNFFRVLGLKGRHTVTLHMLPALPPDPDRKLLARHAHDAIAAALAPSGIAPARV